MRSPTDDDACSLQFREVELSSSYTSTRYIKCSQSTITSKSIYCIVLKSYTKRCRWPFERVRFGVQDPMV